MSKILEAFSKKEPDLRRIIAKYRSNPADIEDLLQDVFLTCYALDITKGVKRPEHLLARVARNLALNQATKKINKTSSSLQDFEISSVLIDKTQVSAEHQLDERRKLYAFAEVLADLPEREREIFILRRIEGLKIAQISTRLGVSASTVERMTAKAMLTCYKALQSRGYDLSEFGVKSNKVKQQSNISAFAKLSPYQKTKD